MHDSTDIKSLRNIKYMKIPLSPFSRKYILSVDELT